MTKDELSQRIVALRNGETAILKQLEDAKNSLIAQRGAIQECEFWISQIQEDQKLSIDLPEYPKLPVAGEA